jgi:hypothetical protein
MTEENSASAKVYPTAERGKLSILDMLEYFVKHGAMRVSDLHIKIGTPPAYRIAGDLVNLKGPAVTSQMAKQLLYPLLSNENMRKLRSERSVDSSYRLGKLQFRNNIFMENDGLAGAIRALSLDIPPVEDIGFPNDVWKDIVERKHGLVLMTGITGAGKSTTIASIIDRIAEKRACRIMSVEDPIEYIFNQKHSMISQREVGRDVRSFAQGLKEMLRRDGASCFLHAAYERRHRHGDSDTGLFPGRPASRGAESAFARAGLYRMSETHSEEGRERKTGRDGNTQQQLRLCEPDTYRQGRAALLATANEDSGQAG